MNVNPHPALEDVRNRALLRVIEGGLPLTPRPYATIGEQLGFNEDEVLFRLQNLMEQGIIKRMGIIVRHRALGYRANGMVVWDVPDDKVAAAGCRLGSVPFITLCYRRPRRLPEWPYNLFTMIHGQNRDQVIARVVTLQQDYGMQLFRHQLLFSHRCFKQRGARYNSLEHREESPA